MAERSARRAGRPQDAQAQDPFAELTRIIGFDPRVKILKPAGAAQAKVAPAPLPPHPGAPEPGPERGEDWETEFSGIDFGLAPPAENTSRKPEAAATPTQSLAVSQADAQSPEPLAPVAGEPASESAGNASPPMAELDAGSFETSGEIDEITDAFEREWHARAAWTPTTQATSIRTLPASRTTPADDFIEDSQELQQDVTAEMQAFAAEAQTGENADEFLDNDLDDVLAASMQLDLDGDWMAGADPLEPEDALAAEGPALPARVSREGRDREPAGRSEPAVQADAPIAGASRGSVSFEDELTALLGGIAPTAVAQPRNSQAAEVAAPARAQAKPAEPPAGPAGVEEASPRLTRQSAPAVEGARAPVAEPVRTMPPHASRRSAGETAASRADAPPVADEDDPFAALAAMAARYRAAQFTPAQKAETTPKPAAPASPPPATAAEPVLPKHAPEEDMKRPSSVRLDTPQVDTTDVPEQPMMMADDLDIPSNPYEFGEEPRAARSHYNDYDDEFDDLLQEMSTGDRHAPTRRAPAQREAAPAYAPAPRQAAPRPAMPRASTIPEGRAAQRAPAPRNHPAMDPDWDDYAPAARADQGYAYDEAGFDEEFDDDRPTAAPPKPERKRGRWLAALFGSVAIIGAGGAYALKFTGVADSGGPTLVKADAGPLKIRPENPGGAAVPNQENQVYDRVAGLGNAAAPQEKLLSSAEEPVSLDEPADEGSDETLPGLELSGDDADIAPDGKMEDRVDASAADETAEKAPIAVAPRKVRTMVVKPDGTLAAREDAEPAVQAMASDAADVIDTVRKNSMAAGVDETDSTASVTPSSDDAAAGPTAAEPGDDLAAQPAVMQPDGEWTVQIASQPSEAAARSSYADLAKRYSEVLSGRPVSIVKAEIAGKGTFWRVRVAAEDRSEAASLCTNYKAAGGNCFVTK